MADSQKPLLVFVCTPVYGHLMPIRAICKQLILRRYEITFVSTRQYQKKFEEVDCSYVPFEGEANWYEGDINTRWPERNSKTPGPKQLSYDFEHILFNSIPDQHHAIQRAIIQLREQRPGRKITQVAEGLCHGALPITQGARGIKPDGTMGIGVIPMTLRSTDTPFRSGRLTATTPEEKAQYVAMGAAIGRVCGGLQAAFEGLQATFERQFLSLGATIPQVPCLESNYHLNDRFIQMCIPSVEYPRGDAPYSVLFGGTLPKGLRDGMSIPPFCNEIIHNTSNKKILLVCQGTFPLNYEDLTIPVMTALAHRDDILLIVALGKPGGTLPEGTAIPSNTRVIDFIPYDDILPYSDIFVTNAGYGAFQHTVSNGTPVICAGAGEDKPEVSARAEWCGIGVNLRTGKPTEEQLAKAVDEVLDNRKYKIRAMELAEEAKKFDPIGIISKTLDEMAAGIKI